MAGNSEPFTPLLHIFRKNILELTDKKKLEQNTDINLCESSMLSQPFICIHTYTNTRSSMNGTLRMKSTYTLYVIMFSSLYEIIQPCNMHIYPVTLSLRLSLLQCESSHDIHHKFT
jgi:hypothetical protein